jgi:hypothetical protein
MIGVVALSAEHQAVCEFFELFKTPWEFYRAGRSYDVIIDTIGDHLDRASAKLILVYSGRETAVDEDRSFTMAQGRGAGNTVEYRSATFSIYGDLVTFQEYQGEPLAFSDSQLPIAYVRRGSGSTVARIGYGLFSEVAVLLTAGQPVENAAFPTLDLHIALLRDLIVENGVTLTEIPPVPRGYRFVACLTHDVDHPLIGAHRFDHTMGGFLQRALVGSALDLCKGRLSWRKLWQNWLAAAKLGFVYLGMADDFWSTFEAYSQLEQGLPSSFFVIPFAKNPGHLADGKTSAPAYRGSGYGAADIADQLGGVIARGGEVGVHGINAWSSATSGQAELKEIRRVTKGKGTGIRMHWLYFSLESPALLEQAGFDYDSTVGYNETVGYRAGTGQVFKPLNASRLLELPLHVMDTALFYPDRMSLTVSEAKDRVNKMIENAMVCGGAVTINWHDRSIAPERLWGDFYRELIQELRGRGAWFATAAQATEWFRKRRSYSFQTMSLEDSDSEVVSIGEDDGLPQLWLQVWNAPTPAGAGEPA